MMNMNYWNKILISLQRFHFANNNVLFFCLLWKWKVKKTHMVILNFKNSNQMISPSDASFSLFRIHTFQNFYSIGFQQYQAPLTKLSRINSLVCPKLHDKEKFIPPTKKLNSLRKYFSIYPNENVKLVVGRKWKVQYEIQFVINFIYERGKSWRKMEAEQRNTT